MSTSIVLNLALAIPVLSILLGLLSWGVLSGRHGTGHPPRGSEPGWGRTAPA